MSKHGRQYRQYLGLVVVLVAYVGGIIGWSWAAMGVESEPVPPDSGKSQVETHGYRSEPAVNAKTSGPVRGISVGHSSLRQPLL